MPQRGSVRYFITDENGQFHIADLRPGDYDVYAVPGPSTSLLTPWKQRVHLPKERPTAKVTIQMGAVANRQG